MRSVFVDTGAWIALTVRRDRSHSAAAAYTRRLAHARIPLLTTNYILLETYTYLRYHEGHQRARQFDGILQKLRQTKRLTTAWIAEEVHEQALEIFWKFDDQAFSVTDCTSFIIARDRKIREVFGFDSHFLTMGFVLKPGPVS